MVQQPDDAQLRAQAEKRVGARIAFHRHLASYLIINAFIILIWLIVALTSGGSAWWPWFIFPLVGWGIGLAFHAVNTYGAAAGGARHEKMVQREMDKQRERDNNR